MSIGHGILMETMPPCQSAPESVHIEGIQYFRIMNVFLLPCEPWKLQREQIIVINRHRDLLFHEDQQFTLNRQLRQFFTNFIKTVRPRSVVELGCGKHPLSDDLADTYTYRGVDIDPDAVSFNRRNGVSCYSDAEAVRINEVVDIVVALFVFHFGIPQVLLSHYRKLLSPAGLVAFNLNRVSSTFRRETEAFLDEMRLAYTTVRNPVPALKGNTIYLSALNNGRLAEYHQVWETLLL